MPITKINAKVHHSVKQFSDQFTRKGKKNPPFQVYLEMWTLFQHSGSFQEEDVAPHRRAEQYLEPYCSCSTNSVD